MRKSDGVQLSPAEDEVTLAVQVSFTSTQVRWRITGLGHTAGDCSVNFAMSQAGRLGQLWWSLRDKLANAIRQWAREQ